MKILFKIGRIAICVILILACSHKKEKQQQAVNVATLAAEKKLTLGFVGEIEFIRSYSEIQNMQDEKEIYKYMKEQDESNTFIPADKRGEPLLKRFDKLGIVNDNELLLSKFKWTR